MTGRGRCPPALLVFLCCYLPSETYPSHPTENCILPLPPHSQVANTALTTF